METIEELRAAFDSIAEQLVRAEQTLRDCEAFVGACRFAQDGGLVTLRQDATTLYKQIRDLAGESATEPK